MCFKRRPRFMRMFLKPQHNGEGKVYIVDPGKGKGKKTHLTKREIATKYRLHFFVAFIFLCALLFVSLGWYYKDLTREEDLLNQKIFLDPRTRILTLTDEQGKNEYRMRVGRNLPPWQLPLHCPELEEESSRECLWKSNAVLKVKYEHPPPTDVASNWGAVHCYRVTWQTLKPRWVPEDCFELGNWQWYGPSNQSAGIFPIQGSFDYVPTPYHLSNSGVFSSVVELYWLNSKGVGIMVNASDPVTVHWNTKLAGHVCVVSNYTGPLFGRNQRSGYLPSMNYTVCVGPDPITTHLSMKPFGRRTGDPSTTRRPSDVMMSYPQWSASGLAGKADYGQSDVEDMVDRIKAEGLGDGMLHFDGEWQRYHGDLTFDPLRFPAISNLTDLMRNSTLDLGVQIDPYFDYRTADFPAGIQNSYFVRDAGGQVPGFVRVRQGAAMAVLDVTSSTARTWYKKKVKTLTDSLGGFAMLKSLWLSLGDEGWLPYKPTLSDDKATVRQLKRQMAEMGADLATSFTIKPPVVVKGVSVASDSEKNGPEGLVLSHAAASQSFPGFIPVVANVVMKETSSLAMSSVAVTSTMCLANVIEKALTLGLLGYPYVMADGVKFPPAQPVSLMQSLFQHNPQLENDHAEEEMYVRWMQLAAFFPAAKFSAAPWRYGEDAAGMARNMTRLHRDLVLPILQSSSMRDQVENKGLPILRPVWWLDSNNRTLHEMYGVTSRQFLVGDDLLVAPVLCVGETRRQIYIPQGVWEDQVRGTLVLGPKVLENYRVALYEVPHFLRMQVYEEYSDSH